jgi:hypothetical protein
MVTRDSSGQGFMNLGPAIVADLNPGEEIQNVAPTRPNGAFDPFWTSLLGQISSRIQLPPEVILGRYNSSYTAARGALLQFWKFVITERENLLAPNFCQPIFEAWMAEEVSSGRIAAPGFFRDPILRAAYCSAKWIGDNPPILDPLKEVMAAQEQINYGLTTHAEQTARLNGGDFEANLPRLAREIKLKKDAGITPDIKPPVAPIVNTDPNAPDNTQDGPTAPQKARMAALERLDETYASMDALRRDVAAIAGRAPIQVTAQAPDVHITMPPIPVAPASAPTKADARTVQLVRDSEGRITGAQVITTPKPKTVQLERDVKGRLTGAYIEEEN